MFGIRDRSLSRRAVVLMAAGAGALAIAGAGTAAASLAANPPAPGKAAAQAARISQQAATGTSVTLSPGGYSSGTATCPADTEIFGGGESNTAPGTLVLTDSYPVGNDTWRVYVKNNGTTSGTFTPYAVCR